MEEDRQDLLAQVAVWYYEEGLDQAAIAERINKSRSMVSRLLDQARASGLVEVKVHYPLRTDAELARQMCAEFGLASAQVLAEPPDDYKVTPQASGRTGRPLPAAGAPSRHHHRHQLGHGSPRSGQRDA